MKRTIILLAIIACITAFSAAQAEETAAFRQEGIASWYGGEFNGRPTASGEIFNMAMFTAAHPTLPFGTVLTVTNTQNMRTVIVRVNDRGPFIPGRIIDLSRAAAEVLDMLHTGLANVVIERFQDRAVGFVESSFQEAAASSAAAPAAAAAPVETAAATSIPDSQTVQAPESLPAVTQDQAQAANILGGIPSPDSTKLYRLQVGSYRIPRFAVDAFEKLTNAGLDPKYEPYEEFYRVVLPGLKAGDIPSIAQILGNIGIHEALIREEN